MSGYDLYFPPTPSVKPIEAPVMAETRIAMDRMQKSMDFQQKDRLLWDDYKQGRTTIKPMKEFYP